MFIFNFKQVIFMSKLVERLAKELSSARDNHELVNVNFFLGDERNITQEQLAEEALKGLSQIKFGATQKVQSVDSNIHKLTIEEFLR